MIRHNKNRRRFSDRRQRSIHLFGYRLVLRRFLPFVTLLLVFAISAGMLIDYGVHSVQRKADNAQLRAEYEQAFVVEPETNPIATVETTAAIDYRVHSVQRKADNAQLRAEYEQEFVVEPETNPIAAAETTAAAEPLATLAPYYHDFSGAIPERARDLYNQNNDLVGWLYIKGVVSLPVVQRDNSFYLNHDFKGKKNDGGALFLDQYHPMAPETQHLLIHGHNMHDSSMFGIVSSYDNLFKVQNYGFARFSTLHAPEDYVICAVLRISTDMNSRNYFNYVNTANFASETEFINFAKELKNRSMFDIPVDMQPSDGLLSLATCSGDDRLLVVFRRIREGESKDALQQLLNQATKK